MPLEIPRDHLDRIFRSVWRDAPDRFLSLALRVPDVRVHRVLDSQPVLVRKGVDAVCEAEDTRGRFIAHVEIEASAHPGELPARMWAYGALLHANTGLPVRASVLLLEPCPGLRDRFALWHGRRLVALYRYEVMRLYEIPATTLARDPDFAVFAALGDGPTPDALLVARDTLAAHHPAPQVYDLLAALYTVSGRRFDPALLDRIFSQEQLMQSATYEHIIQLGEQRGELRGELRGEKRGELRGELRGRRDTLQRLARRRFPDAALDALVQGCPPEHLDDLADALITAPDAATLEAWLRAHQAG